MSKNNTVPVFKTSLTSFYHVPTKLDVVFIPQFFMFFFFFLRHLKFGEVAVETTEARLAPGSTVEYSTTLLSLISCTCCTCVQWVYSVVQLGLSHNNFCKYTGRKKSRMDRFENKINSTPLVAAQVYSVVELGLSHNNF